MKVLFIPANIQMHIYVGFAQRDQSFIVAY